MNLSSLLKKTIAKGNLSIIKSLSLISRSLLNRYFLLEIVMLMIILVLNKVELMLFIYKGISFLNENHCLL